MNENAGQKFEAAAPKLPQPVEDEARVLRLERHSLRIDPPTVRFSVRNAA